MTARLERGSIRLTLPSPKFAVQTRPAPMATSRGSAPTSMGGPPASASWGRRRPRVRSPDPSCPRSLYATQTAPSPTARPSEGPARDGRAADTPGRRIKLFDDPVDLRHPDPARTGCDRRWLALQRRRAPLIAPMPWASSWPPETARATTATAAATASAAPAATRRAVRRLSRDRPRRRLARGPTFPPELGPGATRAGGRRRCATSRGAARRPGAWRSSRARAEARRVAASSLP